MASSDCEAVPSSKDDDGYLSEKDTYDITDSDEDLFPSDTQTTCPGLKFNYEEEKEIKRNWLEEYINLRVQYAKLCNGSMDNEDDYDSIPPEPLKVLPVTTKSCIRRGYCYHREYMTNDTNETSQTIGFHEPKDMLQVLSLSLSLTESCPISVYGIFAIRDDLHPLRNYVFNRTREDSVMIEEVQDSFVLPLCSPCRGMYVLDRALLEVDLWIKRGRDKSTDEQLLCVYVEIDFDSSLDEKLIGRINGDRCKLDMSYRFLSQSVEATIDVSALADNPSHVKFKAFSRCFDEIILFEGKGIMKGELFRHTVAVKAKENLGVRLELDNSVFEWMFQDGEIVSRPSDDLIMNQFQVAVFLAPNKVAPITSGYIDWKIRCRR